MSQLIHDCSIPPNLRFHIPSDYESVWNYGEDSWNLIHIQMANGGVSQWLQLYRKVFSYVTQLRHLFQEQTLMHCRHLKPGYGYVEQVELDLKPRCDDTTLAPDSAL